MKKGFVLSIIVLAAIQLQAQNVGIGTPTPAYPLTVISDNAFKGITQKSGEVEVGFFASPLAAGVQTLSAHNLNFATGGGFARMTIVHPSGFIGIGTTTPAGSFHVKRNTSTDATYSAAQFQGTTYSSYFHAGADETTIISGGKATSPVFINSQSTGGVNIGGTLVPSGSLIVSRVGDYTARFIGTANSSYFNNGSSENTVINGGTNTSPVAINVASTGGVYLSPYGGGVNIGGLVQPPGALDVNRSGTYTARFFGTSFSSYFNVGNNESTFIDGGKATSSVFINSQSTGGVNIGGNVAPAGALDVNRSGNYTARFYGTNNSSYFNQGANENTDINGGKPTSTVTINSASSGNIFLGIGGGNVAIGSITPLASLTVARGTGVNGTAEFRGTTFSSHFNYSTDETTFIRGGKATSQVVLNDVSTGNVRLAEGGGNVGIGVAIPGAKLEVAGQVKITGGSPAAGKVLTSDANGLATWANKTAGDGFKAFAASNTAVAFGQVATLPFKVNTSNGGGAFDDNNNFKNTTNSFVAPRDGTYQFNVTVSLNAGNAAAAGLISLTPTGTRAFDILPIATFGCKIGDRLPPTMSITFLTQLTTGDAISIQVSQTAAAAVTFNNLNSQFTGVRLY